MPPPGPIPVPPVRFRAVSRQAEKRGPDTPAPDGEPKPPSRDRDSTSKGKVSEVQDPLISGDAGKAVVAPRPMRRMSTRPARSAARRSDVDRRIVVGTRFAGGRMEKLFSRIANEAAAAGKL